VTRKFPYYEKGAFFLHRERLTFSNANNAVDQNLDFADPS
jgi:hypothetical protein